MTEHPRQLARECNSSGYISGSTSKLGQLLEGANALVITILWGWNHRSNNPGLSMPPAWLLPSSSVVVHLLSRAPDVALNEVEWQRRFSFCTAHYEISTCFSVSFCACSVMECEHQTKRPQRCFQCMHAHTLLYFCLVVTVTTEIVCRLTYFYTQKKEKTRLLVSCRSHGWLFCHFNISRKKLL